MSITLSQALWPVQTQARARRAAMLVLLGSALLAASAHLAVPFYPVPMTLQTAVVLGLGMAYGWRLGVLTVAVYLMQGALGLPVFSGGVGMAHLTGATGGYLLGFLPAVAITGHLAQRGWDRSLGGTAAAMVLGNAAIYALGLVGLGMVLGWDKPIVSLGLTPFVAGDLLKIALVTLTLPAVWRLLGQR